jgi:hypothetical protein
VTRVAYERRDGRGTVSTLTTEVVAAPPAGRSAADEATTRVLETLRAARIRIGLDAADGVTSVEGIDRALDAAVARDPSLAAERTALRDVCSDDGWLLGLAAAGLCAVADASPSAAAPERTVRVRVPGFGETTMRLAGTSGADEGGTPAVRFEGSLRADAAFRGERGAASEIAGAAEVAGVAGSATTSYPSPGVMPSKGEWSLTVPFAGGRTVRATTTFTLVRR